MQLCMSRQNVFMRRKYLNWCTPFSDVSQWIYKLLCDTLTNIIMKDLHAVKFFKESCIKNIFFWFPCIMSTKWWNLRWKMTAPMNNVLVVINNFLDIWQFIWNEPYTICNISVAISMKKFWDECKIVAIDNCHSLIKALVAIYFPLTFGSSLRELVREICKLILMA